METRNRPCPMLSRRQWLAAAAVLPLAKPAKAVPTAPVAIARCDSYGPHLVPLLAKMFDQIGGLGRLVAGKTVAIKVNLTGAATTRLWHEPAETTYWTHPDVTGATVHLLGRAGARRIRILESFAEGVKPLEEEMIVAGWEPADVLNAAPCVEMENTGFLGYGKKYHRMMVPTGGYIYPGFDLNHSYDDCDVFVSIAKLKEHVTAGVTVAMKNLFGIAPATIYGTAAGKDEPALIPHGGRMMFHSGYRQPSGSAPQEIDFSSPREEGYRVPRIVVDLVAARPIHLSIIDGIETMTTGEGPWVARGRKRKIHHVKPAVMIVGTNPVTTDAVSTAVMGFDPMAERGTPPFETCDSTLELADRIGIGTRDLRQIEVRGVPIRDVVFPFRAYS
jgi:uncharacterized protein (DUF362 family)